MKKAIPIIFAASLTLPLWGCGKTAQENPAPSETTTVKTEEPAKVSTLKLIELDEDSEITHDGDYILSDMYSDILTDESKAEGWFYYYSEGTESGTPPIAWEYSEGSYTGCKIFYTMTNLMEKQEKTFPQRFNGFVIYNVDLKSIPECSTSTEYMTSVESMASSDPDADVFDLTPLQMNNDQLDSDGYPAISKDAVLLKKNESARQDSIAEVTENFLRSWEDDESTKPMWAVFSYDEDTVYLINLRVHMKDIVNE